MIKLYTRGLEHALELMRDSGATRIADWVERDMEASSAQLQGDLDSVAAAAVAEQREAKENVIKERLTGSPASRSRRAKTPGGAKASPRQRMLKNAKSKQGSSMALLALQNAGSRPGTAGTALTAGAAASARQAVDLRRVHAEAALRLRDCIARVSRLDKAVAALQNHHRMTSIRDEYRALVEARRVGATNIQRLFRGGKGRAEAADLQLVRVAEWEQCWDEATDAYFYYHVPTGTSSWYAPADGSKYRPSGWWPTPQPLQPGTCSVCRTEKATRYCESCTWDEYEELCRVDPYKGYGIVPPPDDERYRYREFCFACYALYHRTTRELRTHAFTLLEEHTTPPLVCVECAEWATIRCEGCEENYCDSCFEAMHAKYVFFQGLCCAVVYRHEY